MIFYNSIRKQLKKLATKDIHRKNFLSYVQNIKLKLDKRNKEIDYYLEYKQGKLDTIVFQYSNNDNKLFKLNKKILLKLLINIFSPLKSMEKIEQNEYKQQKEFLKKNFSFISTLKEIFNNGNNLNIKMKLQNIEYTKKQKNKNIYYSSDIFNPTLEILPEISKSPYIEKIVLKLMDSDIINDRQIKTVSIINSKEEYLNKNYFSDNLSDLEKDEKREFIDNINNIYYYYNSMNEIEINCEIILYFKENVDLIKKTSIIDFLKMNGIIMLPNNNNFKTNETGLNYFELSLLTFLWKSNE